MEDRHVELQARKPTGSHQSRRDLVSSHGLGEKEVSQTCRDYVVKTEGTILQEVSALGSVVASQVQKAASQKRLPPLNAIRAFDAVARQGNMSKAARELGVSAPSVTHHVQTLEEFVGVKLITRTPNSISLTSKGKAYSEAIQNGFNILMSATEALYHQETKDPLRISCAPNLGNTWLAAQFALLQQKISELDIHCDFSPIPIDFDKNNIDLAIRYGKGRYPDSDSELLFIDKIAPVCSPELAQRIRGADDLFALNRLPTPDRNAEGRSLWYHWGKENFGATFAERIDVNSGQELLSSRFIVESLKINNSITVVDYVSAREELIRGNLVCPLDLWVEAPFGYYMLTPKRRVPRTATRQLKTFLKQNISVIMHG